MSEAKPKKAERTIDQLNKLSLREASKMSNSEFKRLKESDEFKKQMSLIEKLRSEHLAETKAFAEKSRAEVWAADKAQTARLVEEMKAQEAKARAEMLAKFATDAKPVLERVTNSREYHFRKIEPELSYDDLRSWRRLWAILSSALKVPLNELKDVPIQELAGFIDALAARNTKNEGGDGKTTLPKPAKSPRFVPPPCPKCGNEKMKVVNTKDGYRNLRCKTCPHKMSLEF